MPEHKVSVCFDGARKNLAKSYNDASDGVSNLLYEIRGRNSFNHDKEYLVKAMDALKKSVGIMLYLYDPAGSFNDISNEVTLEQVVSDPTGRILPVYIARR